MKIVFIAGPYSSTTKDGILKNILITEDTALKAAALGVAVVVPNSIGRAALLRPHLAPGKDYDFWLNAELEVLKRCDAMLLSPGWEESSGVAKEIELATKLNIPVFSDIDKLAAWIETY